MHGMAWLRDRVRVRGQNPNPQTQNRSFSGEKAPAGALSRAHRGFFREKKPLRERCLGRTEVSCVCRHIKFWKTHNLVLPDLAPQKWKSVTIWTYREISQRISQEWHSLGEADPALVVSGPGDTTFPWEARVCGALFPKHVGPFFKGRGCLLYTSDAADE